MGWEASLHHLLTKLAKTVFFFSFLKKSEILSQFINQSEIIHSQLFILLRTVWAFLSVCVSVIYIIYAYILSINIYVYILY